MNIATADIIFEIYDLVKDNNDDSFEKIKGEFYSLLIDNKPSEAERFLIDTHGELNSRNYGG